MTNDNKRVNIASELHFIKTGRMDPDDGRLFARIQKYRVEADYSREFAVTDAALREDLAACTGFVTRIRAIVATSLG